MRSIRGFVLFILVLVLCLPPLSAPAEEPIYVVLEDDPRIIFQKQMYAVQKGEDLTLTVYLLPDFVLQSCDYSQYSFSTAGLQTDGLTPVEVTLYQVTEPAYVHFQVLEQMEICYADPMDVQSILRTRSAGTRQRINSLPWADQFHRDGWLAVGWNTSPDGYGTHIGFGSRFFRQQEEETLLYVEWLQCTPEECFGYELCADGAWITGCEAYTDLVIPETLGGQPVAGIRAGAFGRVRTKLLALPSSLRVIEEGAFLGLEAQEVYLFDSLTEVCGASFGETLIQSLHINAARAPVYCGTCYDVFSEVVDRLALLSEQNAAKLILFSGSSGRYGWDSSLLQEAFPGLNVINLGLLSSTALLPQARILLHYVQPGDVLVSSPEMGSVRSQFLSSSALDAATFCMMESNYDMLSLVDLRGFTGIFDAFQQYQRDREGRAERNYDTVPLFYLEDGTPSETPAWNLYGDYIPFRDVNADKAALGSEKILYGSGAVRDIDWDSLNLFYDEFASLGGRVMFFFSPCSYAALAGENTIEGVNALTEEAQTRLHALVLNSAENGLMDPFWFYGDDLHLCTEGARIRTDELITALRPLLDLSAY